MKSNAATLKDDAIALLEEIAELMEMAGENQFKTRAFRKAADTLSREISSAEDLRAVAQGKTKIAGVGEGIKAVLSEFINTGTALMLQDVRKKIPQGLVELLTVPGLGPKKARIIHDDLHVQSVGELEYACRENRLVSLKGFGQATQAKILGSIEMMKRNAGRHLISDAFELAQQLRDKNFKKKEVTFVGELGRHCEVVGVFEFALVADETFARKLPWESVPQQITAKVSSTVGDHVIAGYEGGLPLDGKTQAVRSVVWLLKQPFDTLPHPEQQWLMAAPEVRELLAETKTAKKYSDWEYSWLEAPWVNRKPSPDAFRKSKHGSVRGVFHNHTVASDGVATLEEMVNAAEALGYEYIGISDHSRSAFYAGGLSSEQLLEQNRKIKELQKKFSIKIFHGVESDILQDGALDYPDEVLDKLDFIVGSVHSRFKMDAETMTGRLVRALSNPRVTFWGHPTGRLLLGRDPYAFDWNQICDAAKKSGVAFEINANPQRLDLDWRMGETVAEKGIPVCINPDAHSTDGLTDTQWGEWMAEKAMLPAPLILNLMSVNEMEKYLWQRKSKRA